MSNLTLLKISTMEAILFTEIQKSEHGYTFLCIKNKERLPGSYDERTHELLVGIESYLVETGTFPAVTQAALIYNERHGWHVRSVEELANEGWVLPSLALHTVLSATKTKKGTYGLPIGSTDHRRDAVLGEFPYSTMRWFHTGNINMEVRLGKLPQITPRGTVTH